jgi:hypothetical protein
VPYESGSTHSIATFQAFLDNEQQLLEPLDQAILDVINNPKKTQKTACIGTLL